MSLALTILGFDEGQASNLLYEVRVGGQPQDAIPIDALDHQCGQAAPDAKPPVREHPRYCLSRRCERTLAVVSLNGFRNGAETPREKTVAPLFELAVCSLRPNPATEPSGIVGGPLHDATASGRLAGGIKGVHPTPCAFGIGW